MRMEAILINFHSISISGANSVSAVVQYEQDVTPDVIFGSGNANDSFTTDRRNGIEIGLRGKLRFNGAGLPENTFNSNSNGTYSFQAIVGPTKTTPTPEWSFEWSVNTDFNGTSGGLVLENLTYELGLDADPGPGTNFLVFDPITPNTPPINAPFWDHSIGTNATTNGNGVEAVDAPGYAALIAANNVAQNSWRYDFFPLGPLAGFNPETPRTYAIYLLARNGADVVARADIQILVGGAEPVEPGADHLQCYDIDWSTKLDRRTVNLEDQFAVRENVRVSRRAEKYCTPVNKNGEGITNPDSHLTCYRVKGFKPKRKVKVENQFGEQSFKIDESELLCVPSTQLEVTEVNKGHHHHHHDDE